MDESRLPKKAYKMLYSLDSRGKVNWVTKVKNKLYEVGMGYAWLSQGAGDINSFLRLLRTRLIDCRWQDWYAHIQESDRFDMYRQFNSLHCIPTYLSMKMDRHLKFIMTRFRFGLSDIYVHHYRYRQYTESDLLCPLCKYARESDVHFVFCCPALGSLRDRLIPLKYHRLPSLFRFVLLMSSTQENVVKQFALYLYKAFQLRSVSCM
jgi:hypothetical protein